MAPSATLAAIDRAQGRASLYVNSDIGATSPGRWHEVQLAKKIGATSLLKVGTGPRAAAVCADADEAPASSMKTANACLMVIWNLTPIAELKFRATHRRYWTK